MTDEKTAEIKKLVLELAEVYDPANDSIMRRAEEVVARVRERIAKLGKTQWFFGDPEILSAMRSMADKRSLFLDQRPIVYSKYGWRARVLKVFRDFKGQEYDENVLEIFMSIHRELIGDSAVKGTDVADLVHEDQEVRVAIQHISNTLKREGYIQ